MNTLQLKITNASEGRNIVSVDGIIQRMKRNRNDARLLTYQTENPVVHLTITTYLEVRSRLWWLSAIFFYIISVFGLFDTHENFKCRIITFDANLWLTPGENHATLRLRHWREGGEAAMLDFESAQILTNICSIDHVAKQRRVILRICKILILTAALVLIALKTI